MENTLFDSLIGRTITNIYLADAEHLLKFVHDQGELIVEVEGDCCSESWWSDIVNVYALRGAVVQSWTDLSLPNYNIEDGKTRQEYDSVYGYAITTNKGTSTLAFRNSSNGYYGGWAEVSTSLHPDDEWKEVTKDYPQ